MAKLVEDNFAGSTAGPPPYRTDPADKWIVHKAGRVKRDDALREAVDWLLWRAIVHSSVPAVEMRANELRAKLASEQTEEAPRMGHIGKKLGWDDLPHAAPRIRFAVDSERDARNPAPAVERPENGDEAADPEHAGLVAAMRGAVWTVEDAIDLIGSLSAQLREAQADLGRAEDSCKAWAKDYDDLQSLYGKMRDELREAQAERDALAKKLDEARHDRDIAISIADEAILALRHRMGGYSDLRVRLDALARLDEKASEP